MPERFARMIGSKANLWPRCLACAVAALALLLAHPAVAQTTRYWAPDAGAGGSGTWNNTDLFWAANSDGSGTKVAWNSTLTNNVAYFGGTAGTVTTGAAVSTNQIRFDTTGYLLAGDATNTITLNGTTPQVLLADGVAAEISAALAGSAGFSAGASGTTGGTLTLSGTSSLTGTVGIGAGQTVLATGGSLTAGTLDVGTGVAGATSTLRIKSGASMSFNSNSTVGTNSRPTAAVVQEGGTATFSAGLLLGTNGGATTYTGSSSYTMEGGVLNLTNGTNSFMTVGRNATATFTQTGGTVTSSRTTDALTIGDYGSGTYSLTGGTISALGGTGSNMLIGHRGGSGTLSIDGSSALVRIRGSLMLANNDANVASNKGSATVTLAQGTLEVNGILKGKQARSNGYGDVTFTLSGGTLRPYNANVSFGSSDANRNFDITLSGTAGTISGLDASATPVARTVDLYANLVGTGGVTLSGGTINLRGTNTYEGGTTIGAGTVNVLATSAVPATGSYTILSGGTFADSSGFATVGGWLASGRIATASAGTLAFTAATESDAVNLTGYDSLILAATGTSEVSGPVTPSATGLRVGGSGTLTISGAIGGSAGLTKTGNGTLVLSGANTFPGTTTISAGTLEAGSATALGTGGPIAFAGGTLRYGSGVTTDFSGRISPTAGQNVRVDVGGQTVEWATGLSGTGTVLTRSGGGTLTLAGANTHTGGTTLTGDGETVIAATGSLTGPGSILIGNSSGTSTLRIKPGSTVAAGTFAIGNATIPNAAVIQEGGDVTVSTSFEMANSGLANTYVGSSTYELQSGSMTFTGSAYLRVARNGAASFTQSGGTITLARNNDALYVGDYAAGTYTISAGSLTATTAGGNLVVGLRGGSGTLTINGPSARMGFNGAGRFAVNDSGSTGSSATVNLLAGELAINSMSKRSSTGIVNFTLGGGTLRPYAADATFGSATADNNFEITLSGTDSVISGLDAAATPVARTVDLYTDLVGSGGVTLSGGTINLQGTNTYAGGTTITGGIANFAAASAVPATGTFTLTGGGTFVDSAETATVAGWLASGRFATASAGTIAFGSGTATSSDTLDLSSFPDLALGAMGETTYSGTLTPAAGGYRFAASGTLTVATPLTGSSGVTASGTGTTVLTGANDYTGPTTLAGGTLTAGSATALGSGGTISFTGGTLGYGSGITTDFSGRFATGPGQAYAVDTGGEAITWAASLDSSGGSLTKRGAGTLTLTAANAYDGPTAILGGTLVAGAAGSLGSGTISFGGGTLAYGSGVTTDFSDRFSTAASQPYRVDTAGQNVTWATPLVSAAGSLDKTGLGTLTLTADATFSGTTTISGGTLRLGDGGTAGLVAGAIVNNGSLAVDRSDDLTLTAAISGSGGLVKAGSGTLALTGSNSFSGPTAIVGGTLSINGASRLGTAPASPTPGQLSLVGSTLQTTAAVTLPANTGVALAGASRFSISGGRLTTSGVIADGSAAGSVAISGSSDWSPASQSTYTGGTTLEPGVSVILGASSTGDPGSVESGPFGTGSLTLAGGSIRSGNDAARTVANAVSIAADTLFPNVTSEKTLTFTAPATLTGSRTLDVRVGSTVSSSTVTFAAAIGDGGAGHGLTKTGAGRLVLAGNNTYTGATTVSAGSLDIGSGGTTGSLVGNLVADATVRFNRSDDLAYAGTISGTGGLTKLGNGTLTLSGANSHQGGTTLSAGRLNLGSATALGTGTFTLASGTTLGNSSGGPLTLTTNNPLNLGSITFAGPHDLDLGTGAGTIAGTRTVTVDAGTLTIGGAIAGSGHGLTKEGPGRLVLTGANTFTGAVTVSGGELTIAGGNLAGNATRTVGAATGPASVLRIQPGSSVSGTTFAIGNATIPNAAVIQEGGDVTVATALQLANSGLAVTYAGNSTYELQGGSITFTGTGFLQVGRNATSSFTQSGGTITIATTGNSLTVGDYATGSYTMTAGSLAAPTAGGNLLLGNRGGTGTLTIDGPTARMAFNGAGRFAINDTSTTGSSATVNLLAGELALNSMSRVSTTGVVNFTLGGGTLRPYGANATFGSATAGNNFDITLSGTGSVVSGLDAAATPVARTVDLHANLVGSGGLTLSGGTINLRGTNTYAGGTTITGGTVAISSTAALPRWNEAGGFSVAGGSGLAVGSGVANADVATLLGTGNFAANTAIGFDTSAGDRTYSAAIADLPAGPLGLVKLGTGALVLSGASGFTGPTTLVAGTLEAASATALGNGGAISFAGGTLRYGSGVTTDFSGRFSTAAAEAYRVDTAGQNVTWATPLVSAGGSLQKTGTGTLTLTADATFSGTTTITAGTLQLGAGGTAGTVAGGIVNSGLLVVDRSDDITLATAISGSGGLTKQGAGRLVLSGTNSFTGAVTVSAGELTIASGSSLAGNATRTVGSATGPASVLRIQAGSTVAAGTFAIGNATIPNAAVIQEGGDVTVSLQLTMANTGAPGTYAGSSTYELQGGSMTFTGSAYLQVARNATSSFTQSGGTITLARNGDALIVGDYAAGSYTMSAGSLAATTAGGNLVLGNRGGTGTLTINGPTARMGFNGAGRFATNDSSSTGATATVNLLAGELAINSMSKLSSTGVVNFTLGGGTLRPYGTSVATFGSATAGNNFSITLSGTGSVISGLDASETPVARTVEIRTPLVGSGGVTLSGGTLNLRADNTHAGPTTIAPDAFVDLFGSFANSSAITVNGTLDLTGKTTGFAFGSGQTLGGAGTIDLPTTGPGVSLAGFLAPGNSPGTLTLSGAGTFDLTSAINGTTGRLLFELGTPGLSAASDLVLVPDGTLAIGTSLLGFDSFAFTPLAGFGPGTYSLFSTTSISGSLDPARTTGSLGGLSAELTATGTEISLVVVPEPAALALAGAGVIATGFALRRRRAGR